METLAIIHVINTKILRVYPLRKTVNSHFKIYSSGQKGSSFLHYRGSFLHDSWHWLAVLGQPVSSCCCTLRWHLLCPLTENSVELTIKYTCTHTHPHLSFSVSFSALLPSENDYPVDGDAIGYKKGWKISERGVWWQMVFTVPKWCFAGKPGGPLVWR